MSHSLNVSCASLSLRNLYSPAKIPSNPQNPIPASLPRGLSQWEAISPILMFHGSLPSKILPSIAVSCVPNYHPYSPKTTGFLGTGTSFYFFYIPTAIPYAEQVLNVVELITSRWIFEFSVPRPIIYTQYFVLFYKVSEASWHTETEQGHNKIPAQNKQPKSNHGETSDKPNWGKFHKTTGLCLSKMSVPWTQKCGHRIKFCIVGELRPGALPRRSELENGALPALHPLNVTTVLRHEQERPSP